MNNTVIKVLTQEHGKQVIQWWKDQGVDTGTYDGRSNEKDGHSYIYYGVIDDKFNNYSLYRVEQYNATIIELPKLRPEPKFNIGDVVNTNSSGLESYNPFNYADPLVAGITSGICVNQKIDDIRWCDKNNRWWYKFRNLTNWYEECSLEPIFLTPSTFNLANTKIWIGNNPELCRQVQEKAFELGYTWYSGEKTVQYLKSTALYFDRDKKMEYSNTPKTGFFSTILYTKITPEQLGISSISTSIITPKFVIGKWYTAEDCYGKLSGELTSNTFPSVEWINHKGKYFNTGEYFSEYEWKNAREVDLSEIQHYLPDGHPDKYVTASIEHKYCPITFKEIPSTPVKENLIGRYIKALVNSPDGGSVQQGEIGVITEEHSNNTVGVDFPSHSYYIATYSSIYKYELMPKDYNSSKPTTMIGRWVKVIKNCTTEKHPIGSYLQMETEINHLDCFYVNGFDRCLQTIEVEIMPEGFIPPIAVTNLVIGALSRDCASWSGTSNIIDGANSALANSSRTYLQEFLGMKNTTKNFEEVKSVEINLIKKKTKILF